MGGITKNPIESSKSLLRFKKKDAGVCWSVELLYSFDIDLFFHVLFGLIQ